MNNEKTLLEYAIKMRRRGDTYRYISNHVNAKAESAEIADKIIKKISDMESSGQLQIQIENTSSGFNIQLVMGVIVTVLSIGLMFFLWDKGFVSFLPIMLIAGGLIAIGKSV